MLIENIKLAFNAMRGSKMRTALSLLGIVIGVASVVAILTIGQSASQSITESIAVGGLYYRNFQRGVLRYAHPRC